MMKRLATLMFAMMLSFAMTLSPVHATETTAHHHHHHRKKVHMVNYRKLAEAKGYKKVSSLVDFPEFFPGLGIIYVVPDTLPTGPFLSFDRRDNLIATIYMIPIDSINEHKQLDLPGFTGKADHASFYFNPGHAGVQMPHYHFVIWHVSKKGEASVAK